jgi:hypothetical protein
VITLSYTDLDSGLASSCSLSSLNNVSITQACACNGSGVCTVGVKGTSNYNGAASFRYQVVSSGKNSSISTVSLTINPIADSPTVATATLLDLIYEDVESGSLRLNYTDPDGDRAGATDCQISNKVNLTDTVSCSCDVILGYCSLKVTGSANYFGAASFDYSVRTNGTWSNTATANVSLISVDDASVASDITPANFSEDVISMITLSYTDIENNKATSCAITNLTNITITNACACDGAGVCTVGVRGTSNYSGSASFNYTVRSNSQNSNSALASLTIDAIDDAPVTTAISPSSFNEDVQSIITLAYSDAESDLATSCALSSLTNVTVTQACACDGAGVCTVGVAGTTNYVGSASFQFNVTANGLTSNNSISNLNIIQVNDPPTIAAISNQYTAQNQLINVTVVIDDVDGPLGCSSALSASSSNVGLIPVGNIVFSGAYPNCSAAITPVNNQNGNANLTFTVSDGAGTAQQVFNLTVRAPVTKTWLMGNPGDVDTYALSSAAIAQTSAGVAYLVPSAINQLHSVSSDFPFFPTGLTWDGVNSVVKRSETITVPFSVAYSSKIYDGLKSTSWTNLTYKTSMPFGKSLPDYTVIALIPLEELSGAVTEKYNSISFTATGSPTYNVAAKVAKGITFANAPYFQTAYNANLNPTEQFSVCTWVKPAAVGAGYKSFLTSRDTNKGYAFYVNNKFEFWIGNGSSFTILTSTTTPSTAAFSHVCGMFDGTTASLTVNGVAEATATTTFVPNTLRPTRIAAGKTETTATEFFNGTIDEISIHNRALTTTELSALNGLTKYLPQSVGTTLANTLYNHELIADYPLISTSTLLTNLVSMWHFDEAGGATSLRNGASKSLNAFVGSLSVGGAGKIGNAVSFDGSSSYITSTTHTSANVNSNAFTISTWIRTTSANNEQIISFAAAHSPLGIDTGKLKFTLNSVVTAGTKVINDGLWHHVAVSGSGTACKVYVDGNTTTADISYTCTTNYAMGSTPTFGRLSGAASNYYTGMLDETAIWTRALSVAEIGQLYRRGINSLTMDVRSCAASDCSDGTYAALNFSELLNKDSLGNIYNTPPKINFTVANNRYLQYKATFNSEVSNNGPELRQVSVGPTHYTYTTTDEYIVPQSALSFKTLSSITETLGANGCSSSVRYQLSSDKINWKYFNGTAWVTGIDYATASTLSNLNAGLVSYTSASPTVSDNVYIRAFLESNGANECELDQIVINGNN